jgi:CRP-like cAMP-binding protein
MNFVEKLKAREIPSKRVSYRANSLIFSEMDVPCGMYLIESGEVKILKRIPDTNKDIDLATFGPNEFFGEISLMTGRARSADALAITDCLLWLLDEKDFREAIAKCPDFSFMILKGMAKRLTDTNEKMRDLFSHLRDFSERLEGLSTLRHTLAP